MHGFSKEYKDRGKHENGKEYKDFVKNNSI